MTLSARAKSCFQEVGWRKVFVLHIIIRWTFNGTSGIYVGRCLRELQIFSFITAGAIKLLLADQPDRRALHDISVRY